MPKLNDTRSVRSQQAFRDALIGLMDELRYEDISLKEIFVRASASYPTFYRHYADKDDLLFDVARKEAESFGALQPRTDDVPVTPGERIRTFVGERRGLWTKLLSPGAMPIARQAFIEVGHENARRGLRFNQRFPDEIATRVFASSLFEILAWWFQQPAEYPVDTIDEMIESLVVGPLSQPKKARKRIVQIGEPKAEDKSVQP